MASASLDGVPLKAAANQGSFRGSFNKYKIPPPAPLAPTLAFLDDTLPPSKAQHHRSSVATHHAHALQQLRQDLLHRLNRGIEEHNRRAAALQQHQLLQMSSKRDSPSKSSISEAFAPSACSSGDLLGRDDEYSVVLEKSAPTVHAKESDTVVAAAAAATVEAETRDDKSQRRLTSVAATAGQQVKSPLLAVDGSRSPQRASISSKRILQALSTLDGEKVASTLRLLRPDELPKLLMDVIELVMLHSGGPVNNNNSGQPVATTPLTAAAPHNHHTGSMVFSVPTSTLGGITMHHLQTGTSMSSFQNYTGPLMSPHVNGNLSNLATPHAASFHLAGGFGRLSFADPNAAQPSSPFGPPRSPWVPVSPQMRRHSTQVPIAVDPAVGSGGAGDISTTPSSMNTSLTSLRPTPKLTNTISRVTDAEGFVSINDYVILEEAGAGRFGRVVLASLNGSSELRAIKSVAKRRLRQRWHELRHFPKKQQQLQQATRQGGEEAPDNGAPPVTPAGAGAGSFHRGNSVFGGSVANEDMMAIQREVAIMKRLRHKHIVPLYEVIDDPEDNHLYLVMRYVEKGPIVRLDDSWSCNPLDVDMVRGIVRQAASGLAYLHRHHIAHRDIKPDNILQGADGNVYLSDFGVSQLFESDDDHVSSSDGTPAYAAPEIVRGVGEFSAMKADVWALGVTMYILVFGRAPFQSHNILELNEQIVQKPVCYDVHAGMAQDADYDDAIDLLKRMLERDPEKRATARDVTMHIFLTRGRKPLPPRTCRKQSAYVSSRLSITLASDVLPPSQMKPVSSGTEVNTSMCDSIAATEAPPALDSLQPLSDEDSDPVDEPTEEEILASFTPLVVRPPTAGVPHGAYRPFRRDWDAFE